MSRLQRRGTSQSLMVSPNTTNHNATREAFRSQSIESFLVRMDEIEQVVRSRTALATLEYIESQAQNKELPPKEFMRGVIEYGHSHPIRRLGYHAINEATMVLLSACLEGFIENLHEEAMGELLDERVKSKGVLKSLVGYAHKRFGNPWPHQIKGLFNTCGMADVVSSLNKSNSKEIRKLVEIRNKIAHGGHMSDDGRDIEDWLRIIRAFADDLNSAVVCQISAMRK